MDFYVYFKTIWLITITCSWFPVRLGALLLSLRFRTEQSFQGASSLHSNQPIWHSF